jgi:hypothetical protein
MLSEHPTTLNTLQPARISIIKSRVPIRESRHVNWTPGIMTDPTSPNTFAVFVQLPLETQRQILGFHVEGNASWRAANLYRRRRIYARRLRLFSTPPSRYLAYRVSTCSKLVEHLPGVKARFPEGIHHLRHKDGPGEVERTSYANQIHDIFYFIAFRLKRTGVRLRRLNPHSNDQHQADHIGLRYLVGDNI